jgi:Lrp/AsnC family leucine-responsive transcriptional regulator
MDEKDLQILKSIEELETTSTDAVSDATGIPISTVHYRLNNLREEGIIANDRLDIDLDELGLDITVLVEVFLKGEQNHRESGQTLADIEGVTKVFFTMGETDFVTLARLPSSESVERLISDFEALDDVARTNSTFVISRELDSHYPLQQYSEESLAEELLE